MASPIAGVPLVTKSGAKAPADALKGKVVALYFSAHWCPPCRGFTPALKGFYETLQSCNENLEIVFVSGDKSEQEFKEYFENDHGDWLAVDFNAKERTSLSQHYQVRGIPSLIVLNGKGESVVPDARQDVAQGQAKTAFAAWKKAAGDWRESAGAALGGSAVKPDDAAAIRAARLAKLGGGPPPPAPEPAVPEPAVPDPATRAETTSAPPAFTCKLDNPGEAAAPTLEEPTDADADTDGVDSTALAQLTSMGFSEDQASNALAATGGNIEQAIEMLMDGGEPVPAATGPAPMNVEVDPAAVAQLTSMGFQEDQARQVLESTNGDVEQAIAILLA